MIYRPFPKPGAVTGTTSTAGGDEIGAPYPCLEEDPELFFPSGTTGEYRYQIAAAKEVCRSCDFTAECLRGALERREPWGVWGAELLDGGRIRRRPGREAA